MAIEDSIQLKLSHHEMTSGMGYQQITIELVSRDRIITPAALSGLPLPAGIDPRKGVLISGRGPIWLYTYLVHECHPALWVACFDPRLGAVVTSTHSTDVRVGQVMSLEVLGLGVPEIQGRRGKMKDEGGRMDRECGRKKALGAGLLVVGPPDSGKSVLSHQIFSTLVRDYPNIYLQRAHWDGEGNWILELPESATDEERETLKRANKGTLTENFFSGQRQAILNLRWQKSLVIVDVGGMVQPEKRPVMEMCTHYLIISSKPEEIEAWHQFCREEGKLMPLAVIHSTLEEKIEILQSQPFLEMVCGPWVMGRTKAIPAVLHEVLMSLVSS